MPQIMLRLIIVYIIITLMSSINSNPMNNQNKREVLKDHLLSQWTMGGVKDDSGSRENGKSPEDSLKSLLVYLTNKAAASSNRKITSAAREGIHRILSHNDKIPKSIDLHKQTAMEAVLHFFQEMDINSEACRLNAICELLTEPQASYGVFGELVGYVFGKKEPDSSDLRSLDARSYNKLYQAAQDGRHMKECSSLYKNCSLQLKNILK